MRYLLLFAIPVILLFSFTPPKSIRWKGGKKAAICLTYDDGMRTHLENAIPQLDEVGLKGTFFINTTEGKGSVLGWKKAAKDGHELANHTLFHPCAKASGWPDEIANENYTIPQILDEISVVNGILRNLDPTRKSFTYAYPCCQTEVGGKSYVDALLKSKLVTCARVGGTKENSVVSDFTGFDKMNVPSWGIPKDSQLKDLIEYAESARKKGGLAVFQFHGIGGQWIDISNETHKGLLKYLSENQSDFWIAPFSDVVEYIEQNKDRP